MLGLIFLTTNVAALVYNWKRPAARKAIAIMLVVNIVLNLINL